MILISLISQQHRAPDLSSDKESGPLSARFGAAADSAPFGSPPKSGTRTDAFAPQGFDLINWEITQTPQIAFKPGRSGGLVADLAGQIKGERMSSLKTAIETMVDLQLQMSEMAMSGRRDPSQRTTLVDMRRRFAQLAADVSQAIDHEQFPMGEADREEFRARFSEMRSLVGIHQCKWPAANLEDADESFFLSAKRVTDSNRTFAEWALKILS